MRLTKRKSQAEPPAFYNPARDGVTQGLLSTFLACRQRARIYLQGWSGAYSNFHLVFGTFVHYILRCAYTQHREGTLRRYPDAAWVRQTIDNAYELWKVDNPKPHEKAQAIVEEVMMKAQAIMPHYFYYWRRDFTEMVWIEVEETFKQHWSVTARDGTLLQTFMRGRIDGAYVLPNSAKKAYRLAPRLLETKSRVQIDEQALVDTMPHDRQTNVYLSALRKKTGREPRSVMMNIIRKTSLRQKQAESWAGFAKRIESDVKARMDHYFVRMEMVVNPQDINRQEEEINDMVHDFLLWWKGHSGHYKNSDSCRPPGMAPCPYLRVCAYGDYTGLVRRPVVFRELEDME